MNLCKCVIPSYRGSNQLISGMGGTPSPHLVYLTPQHQAPGFGGQSSMGSPHHMARDFHHLPPEALAAHPQLHPAGMPPRRRLVTFSPFNVLFSSSFKYFLWNRPVVLPSEFMLICISLIFSIGLLGTGCLYFAILESQESVIELNHHLIQIFLMDTLLQVRHLVDFILSNNLCGVSKMSEYI